MPQVHEYADIFPKMKNGDLAELKESIREHGQQTPIVLTKDGQILDGRNRYVCCTSLGIEPIYETYEGDDLLGYVIRANLHRRHLDESQRAMIATRLATLAPHRPESASIDAVTQDEAATLMRVGRAQVQRARKVVENAEPELVEAVDAGKVAVSVAAQLVDAAPEDQRAVAQAEEPKKEATKVKRRVREEAAAAKAVHKTEELGIKQYGVIYADPPWRFEPYSRETGMDRAADNHYPTMTADDIADLDVPAAAADDCVLFLWATAPMLCEALDVMASWGFDYKSHWIWNKAKAGTGYWSRNKHELLLIGTRGDVPAPIPGSQPESVIPAPQGVHSAKPEAFREIIDHLFPALPKVELFARQPAPGWDVWGNEVESAA